jgi:hypothetical protein
MKEVIGMETNNRQGMDVAGERKGEALGSKILSMFKSGLRLKDRETGSHNAAPKSTQDWQTTVDDSARIAVIYDCYGRYVHTYVQT